MEFIDRLNVLLDSLADIMDLSRNQLLLLLAGTVLLAALLARYVVSRLSARKGEDDSVRELSESERLRAEQNRQVSELLASQHEDQQRLAETLLLIRQSEAEDKQQLASQVSFLTQAIGNLARHLETMAQAQTPTVESSVLEQDWRSKLPRDAEARVAALEQRRNYLFSAIRECNQALEEARRALVPVPPGSPLAPESEREITETESEEDTQAIDQDVPDEQDSAETDDVPPAPITADLSETDFTIILPEDYEREFLRLILRENGSPGSDSVRIVLGDRFPHAVRDEINERALDELGDILLYEEQERLVVTEEFVDSLRSFLNDRAVPERRI